MPIVPTRVLLCAFAAAALSAGIAFPAAGQEGAEGAGPAPSEAEEETPDETTGRAAEEAATGKIPIEVEKADDEGPPVEVEPVEPVPPGGRIPEDMLEPAREEELVELAVRGLTPSHARRVRVYYKEALRAYRALRYRVAVRYCEEGLRSDPDNIAVQRMLYTAKTAWQKHRLRLEAEHARFLDEEALAYVDRETTFLERPEPLPRPQLPLRENAPKSARLRRMQELLNQRISMNFIDADLDYVLQTLFKISGVDIIAEQSVVADKTLTLHVENVPLREILEFIRRNYEGITYTVTENAVWLVTPEKPPLVPRVYALSRGIVSSAGFQTGVRTTRRRGGAAGQAGTTPQALARAPSGGGGGGGGGGDSHLETVLTWVESWEDEWPPNSKWHLDRQTNSLMVLTTPEMHERIEEMLDIMDTVPIQVLVRTKFIEVRAEDMKELGLGLLFIEQDTDLPKFPVAIDSGQLTYRKTFDLPSKQRLIAEVRLLMEDKRTKVLSAPQIIAMNNTPAQIDISKSFSYATSYDLSRGYNFLPGGGAVDIPSAFVPGNFQDVDVGFFLEFVPSVGRDMKNIVLDLHARVDDILGNIEDFTEVPIMLPQPAATDGNGASYADLISAGQAGSTFQRPVIDSREFTTRLVIEDGGMVVIGGLLKNNREVLNRKVPILGDIPLIGLLFRARKEKLVQSNLIIVVQANIVTPSGRTYKAVAEEAAGEPGGAEEEPDWFTEFEPQLEGNAYGYDY